MTLIRKVACLALGISIASIYATTANAASGAKVGTLVCNVDGGVSQIITSKKAMGCSYTAVGGHIERYSGVIRKYGLDVGVTEATKMVWIVFAPGSLSPGALKGKYAGAVADASLGIGVGVKVLVGGSKKSISLQPISVQGQAGINLAIGVGTLTLE